MTLEQTTPFDSIRLVREDGSEFWSARDLQPLLELEPELILLGGGAAQAFPPPATMAACLSRGIGLETMTNAAAARTFNVLASEGRRVVAGFVLRA